MAARKALHLTLGICLCLIPTIATAESSLRCDDGLVTVGDNKLQVQRSCGEPVTKSVIRGDYSIIEEWHYNLGAGDFLYLFTFEHGQLKTITRLGRGYNGKE